MPSIALARIMTAAVSTVLGGLGVFCLLMSFAVPRLGAEALLLLGSATAMVYAAKG